MPCSRGTIRNATSALQLRDYLGLCWNRITPTDIDGLLDFGGRAFVLFELKAQGAPLPRGQELAIERVVDAIESGGAFALGLVAEHITAADTAIDAAVATVIRIRWRRSWRQPACLRSLRDTIDRFLEWVALP